MPAIGYRQSLAEMKSSFFDRRRVTDRLRPGLARGLSRFGYFVMRDARQRIRKRRRPSRPGEGPTFQGGPLKPLLLFAFDAARESVVIGPARLNSRIAQLEIPRLLEEGGTATITGGPARGQHYTLAPRPYLRPAFERQLDRQRELLQGILR